MAIAAAIEEAALAELTGGSLPYTLRRSPRARRVRVVVDPARGVVVTVPGGRRLGAHDGRRLADEFVTERESWIRRHLDRHAEQQSTLQRRAPLGPDSTVPLAGRDHALVFAPAPPSARRSMVLHDAGAAALVVRLANRDRRPLEEVLRTWYQKRAREAIEAAITAHAPHLGVNPSGISIRDQRTRWGSASRNGRLSFSWRLILAPPEALETVVIHELAHLRVFGHGSRFWAHVAARRADHRTWRRWLREHSFELHAVFEG